MYITKKANSTLVEASTYAVEVSANAISVILAGEEVANLRPVSAVDTVNGEDTAVDKVLGEVSFRKTKIKGNPAFIWTAKSENWEKTEYVLVCKQNNAEYFVRVSGKGDIERVNYFIGEQKDGTQPGSDYEFDTYYAPVPTVKGNRQGVFSAMDSYLNKDGSLDSLSYLTVPPMFVFTYDICGIEPKLAMGLVAKKGEHNFTEFNYITKYEGWMSKFWFTTDQTGHVTVDGTWETPAIIIYGADNRSDSLKYYAEYYYNNGIAKRKDPTEKKPRFWYGPMACGWIEQAAWGIKEGIPRSGVDMAYQPAYDHFNEELERVNLHPQIMIIDDKWQTNYGSAEVNPEKWPDLRGWIDMNLEKYNRHVMLWYKLWDAEGLPDDMCMINAKNGEKRADPTNPKYQAYIKETMHRLLSSDEGCMNAYGLKLDYAFIQPVGRDYKSYSGKFGVELYVEYLKVIYEAVKAAKPEAIVSGSPCHPLFAEYIDHARLHDYFPDLRRCYEEFAFRREIYTTAMPGVLVDTDGAAFRSHRDTMRYMRLAPKLGIPDLYCLTDLPCIHITDEDWADVAKVWKDYSDGIDEMFR